MGSYNVALISAKGCRATKDVLSLVNWLAPVFLDIGADTFSTGLRRATHVVVPVVLVSSMTQEPCLTWLRMCKDSSYGFFVSRILQMILIQR